MAKSLLDILILRKTLELSEAATVKKEAIDKSLTAEDVLYSRGISEVDIAEAKSELTGHPVKYLKGIQIPFDALRDIPEESARHYKMIPLGRREGYLDVGMLFPEDISSQEALKFVSSRVNLPVRIFLITPSDFQTVISEYRSLSGEVTRALGEFEKEYSTIDEIGRASCRERV